ncbi:hypothetical protein K503DRAFT_781515 [Rhizopogon vinicolor AM-OR11-026]|uniref:C3H1-type domain-containing protein n=1 Tax=Rhizopogon vinicolor AM-OR11-026 TaxID=1314800 RepID=A0A1B7N675_9AGAM|nr:hypothetical protein K503DRAFT_781515 [Rhizopogon vinicolor AM-OR11-026]
MHLRRLRTVYARLRPICVRYRYLLKGPSVGVLDERLFSTCYYGTSSSGVCYAYAQTGNRRYGPRCKHTHVEGVDLRDSNNDTERSQTSAQTPLDKFFGMYPKFDYDSSASASMEFYRMCNKLGWGRKDDERKCAHGNFKDALVQQFNRIYGTDVDDLASWRTLCQIVNVSPTPGTLKSCRKAVKKTHVNIVDLIDTKTTGELVTVFVSELKLSEYTKQTGKFFPRDNVYAGSLLRYLLRRIMKPRPEVAFGKKTQSRRTGRH